MITETSTCLALEVPVTDADLSRLDLEVALDLKLALAAIGPDGVCHACPPLCRGTVVYQPTREPDTFMHLCKIYRPLLMPGAQNADIANQWIAAITRKADGSAVEEHDWVGGYGPTPMVAVALSIANARRFYAAKAAAAEKREAPGSSTS